MKKTILFLLFYACVLTNNAQEDRKYYEQVLDTTSSDALKMAALDSLLFITWTQRDYDFFIDHTTTLIDLAKDKRDYDLIAKKAMNALFPLVTIKNEPEKAIHILNDALLYEDSLSDSFLKGGLYLKRGGAYAKINVEKAINDYTTAIEKFEEKDAIYKADAHLFRGQMQSDLGQFVLASEDYKAAYDLFESKGDYEYMLHAKSGEIIMYSKNGFLEKAIKQRKALIKELLEMGLYEYLSTQYYNQSIDHKKNGDLDLLEEDLVHALKYADASNNVFFIKTGIHTGLSELFSTKNNLEKAKYHLDLAEKNLENIPNNTLANSSYLMALTQYQLKTNQINKAKENALQRLELINKIGLDEERINTHLLLSEIYVEQGDAKEALYHLKKHAQLKDSIYSQSKTNALIYYQTLYETERKEKELQKKKSNIAILEEKNNSIKKQYLFGGVTLTLGFMMFFLYKNQKNLRTKKKLQEKYTQDLLLAQEEERKRVSKDLHDGIGQSLLLIKNTVVLSKDKNAKNLVENAIEEVRSISRALHPFQLQEMGITKAIENILYQIDETSPLFVSSEVESIDGLFDKPQQINIYRIVQESLNNVIKHSQATAIKFNLAKNEKNITIRLKDNGIGFDFSEHYHDFSSLGLKTLKERTRLLNGLMKVDTQTGKGTTLEFVIPVI